MSRIIDTITTLIGVGIIGYFGYTVILPKLGGLQLPSFPLPTTTAVPPPSITQNAELVPSSSPSLFEEEDTIGELAKTVGVPAAAAAAPTRPTTATTGGGGGGGSDFNGIKLVYKTTGQKVALPTKASPHENGDRYSNNHQFINYIIVAYLKGSHQAQGCKTDGPNHGGCQSMKPTCLWIDPDLQMSNGSIKYGAEYPHPKANDMPCPSCKSLGMSLSNKWYGYQGIAYQGAGGPSDRWNEVWVDTAAGANGEPGNKWVMLLKENYTKNIPAAWQRPKGLPIDCTNCGSGTGLEAEIRMRGAHGTSIKNGAIVEIVNPTGSAAFYAQSFFNFLQAPTPRRFNSYYNV